MSHCISITLFRHQVDAQLADFRQTLTNLSNVEVDHSEDEVEEMDEKLTALMGHHINLMSWKDKERHRTQQWRDAVEEQLRKLGKDVPCGTGESDREMEMISTGDKIRESGLCATFVVMH